MQQLQSYIPALAALTSFVITYFSIPAIIRLSLAKGLYDKPDGRKKHGTRISPLGGMAIFGGLLISFVFFTAHLANPALNSVLVGLFILFITGVKDDLYPLSPFKKMIGQLLAVSVVVWQGKIRLLSFYGLFGIWELPYGISIAISLFLFLAIINSFNFIDGINGLSSVIGVIVSLTYSYWFWYSNDVLFLILALCIAGALLGFMRYNLLKAQIFMGDSGSMVLGFFAAMLTMNFLKINEALPNEQMFFIHLAALVFAFSILIIPAVDTLRVVFLRVVIKKRSPFAADRNHIHHALLDIGLSHLQATLVLASVNVFFILLTWLLNPVLRAKFIFILIFLLAIALAQIPFLIKQNQKRKARLKADR
jgi:UDP-N-acetylmuramyl pentapeptide phosphotransferase/UDP-N-acetylglucosamine-1-phosphate transferase